MSQIPERLRTKLELIVGNLSVARQVCEYLVDDHSKRGVVSIKTEVLLYGSKLGKFEGSNNGFVTTPIIHSAILDIRRCLDLLGLKIDKKSETLRSLEQHERRTDDFYISDMGLRPISPDEMCDFSLKLLGKSPHGFLSIIATYANKELAHLTKTQVPPDFPDLIDGIVLIREAILVFIYDALQVKRPSINRA